MEEEFAKFLEDYANYLKNNKQSIIDIPLSVCPYTFISLMIECRDLDHGS
ncbi:MAG: hypothetical protein RXR43_10130 [Sulfolobus sp.]